MPNPEIKGGHLLLIEGGTEFHIKPKLWKRNQLREFLRDQLWHRGAERDILFIGADGKQNRFPISAKRLKEIRAQCSYRNIQRFIDLGIMDMLEAEEIVIMETPSKNNNGNDLSKMWRGIADFLDGKNKKTTDIADTINNDPKLSFIDKLK